jgi:ubiquinone biosynthesis monooxygenase Coq7
MNRDDPALTGQDLRLDRLDGLLVQFDRALRTLAATPQSQRTNPAAEIPNADMTASAKATSAALMRVNHSGEVAAQALYYGQALTASSEGTRSTLLKSAAEEGDHLAWCAERIRELGSHTSYLNPIWYAGSFAIGALAGLTGDRNSLGFVAETEEQVEQHLATHMSRLPTEDQRSRAIVSQMSEDEREHGRTALASGGGPLPQIIRRLMRSSARVMTSTSYWV